MHPYYWVFLSLLFWFKTDTQCCSHNPALPNHSHVSALDVQASLSCSGLCNIQPSCEFSLLSLMEHKVQFQSARLPPLINLISLRGRTPWLTSGLHALTLHSLVWQQERQSLQIYRKLIAPLHWWQPWWDVFRSARWRVCTVQLN